MDALKKCPLWNGAYETWNPDAPSVVTALCTGGTFKDRAPCTPALPLHLLFPSLLPAFRPAQAQP